MRKTAAEYAHDEAVRKLMQKATDKVTEPERSKRREANQRRDRRIRAKLSKGEITAEMAWTPEERDVFNKISHGKPMRNAGVVLNALKIKLDQCIGPPSQRIEHSGGVNVVVQTLSAPKALPPEEDPAALPPVVEAG